METARKPRIIAIVGPNTSGKSDLAVRIAQTHNGEIISADSRQVYKELNIGTGKVPGRWNRGRFLYKGVPHYCIDVSSPNRRYSVENFIKCADSAIRDISNRGKIPIIAGGTGFWVDAVIFGIVLPPIPPNEKLRRRLEKKPATELYAMLAQLDPKRALAIDQKNSRRIIRALEIAQALGSVPERKQLNPYDALWLGIHRTPKELKQRIHARLQNRIRDGLIKEGGLLRKKGLTWKRFYELGLEYAYLAKLQQKKITQAEFSKWLENAIWHYAKRQMTWFKRNKKIKWVTGHAETVRLVKRFLK